LRRLILRVSPVPTLKEIVMLYIVYDSEHLPLRRFHRSDEAKWFVRDKPEFTIEKIKQRRTSRAEQQRELFNKIGECLF
jgi:hypothetical protein